MDRKILLLGGLLQFTFGETFFNHRPNLSQEKVSTFVNTYTLQT